MLDFDYILIEDIQEHNPNWPEIPDHWSRIIIAGGSGSGQTNALLNLIRQQDRDELIDKIYLYAKDLDKRTYQLLIKKREDAGLCLNKPKYSNDVDDV